MICGSICAWIISCTFWFRCQRRPFQRSICMLASFVNGQLNSESTEHPQQRRRCSETLSVHGEAIRETCWSVDLCLFVKAVCFQKYSRRCSCKFGHWTVSEVGSKCVCFLFIMYLSTIIRNKGWTNIFHFRKHSKVIYVLMHLGSGCWGQESSTHSVLAKRQRQSFSFFVFEV